MRYLTAKAVVGRKENPKSRAVFDLLMPGFGQGYTWAWTLVILKSGGVDAWGSRRRSDRPLSPLCWHP